MSLLGICLNGGTRAGKRLCIIAFVLTFSPILMIKIQWIVETDVCLHGDYSVDPCHKGHKKECF